MQITVFGLFPDLIFGYCQAGILGKALERKIAEIQVVNLRDFGVGKNKKVDDTPYGGGAGMLLRVEPIVEAFESCLHVKPRILLSPKGENFSQSKAVALSKLDGFSLLCGRYEGIDARVERYVDEMMSIGPYILMGGELAALSIIESVLRLKPGVLGNMSSQEEETHFEGLTEYPQYTKPRNFRGFEVPEVLLSGDHGEIKKWRRKNRSQLEKTDR